MYKKVRLVGAEIDALAFGLKRFSAKRAIDLWPVRPHAQADGAGRRTASAAITAMDRSSWGDAGR